MDNFPVMKGNANMARGASYFEVPLFSHVIDNLWQGCSPAEFPDELEPYNYDLSHPDAFRMVNYGMVKQPIECHWLWVSGDETTGLEVWPRFDRILDLFQWGTYEIPEGTEKLTVEMFDGTEIDPERIDELATKVIEWLDEGHKVLVHCQAGLNRSSLIVGRILMLKWGMSADDAIDHIRSSRSQMCLCNDSFRQFLKEL